MGEIRTIIIIKNPKSDQTVTLDAMIDTGSVMLLLPQDVVEEIGLKTIDKRIVVLANEQKVEMNIAGPVLVRIGKRKMNTDCLVGPPGCEPLVGQIVMEALDLIADPVKRIITPRPESPFLPTLKLK